MIGGVSAVGARLGGGFQELLKSRETLGVVLPDVGSYFFSPTGDTNAFSDRRPPERPLPGSAPTTQQLTGQGDRRAGGVMAREVGVPNPVADPVRVRTGAVAPLAVRG